MFKLKKSKKMQDKNKEYENKAKNSENKEAFDDKEATLGDKEKTFEDSEKTLDKDDEPQDVAEDKVERMGKKLQEVNDKYLRLYSEFENYRKRTSREKIELISNASEDIIKELLPVVDDYERALDSMSKIEDEQVKQTLEGITLIYKKLYSILERKGLKPINAKGEKFDENLHEAIAQMPAAKEEDKGVVIDETTKGYYLNDKVIRYSKVVVAV